MFCEYSCILIVQVCFVTNRTFPRRFENTAMKKRKLCSSKCKLSLLVSSPQQQLMLILCFY